LFNGVTLSKKGMWIQNLANNKSKPFLQQSRQKYKTGHHQGSLKRRRVDRHFYMASLGMNETMKILLLDDTERGEGVVCLHGI
jgi:hypothetical protein